MSLKNLELNKKDLELNKKDLELNKKGLELNKKDLELNEKDLELTKELNKDKELNNELKDKKLKELDKSESIFENIDEQWKSILKSEKLIEIIQTIQKDKFTPSIDKIFEFARHTPLDKIRVIIIGQDPYHQENTAHGLSFSTLSKRTPASLSKIFKALLNSNLLNKKPKSNNLISWAKQGILLLNRSWTTKIGTANAHKKIWEKYTNSVIKLISKNLPNETIWLLWGKEAQSIDSLISKRHKILRYCHPVAYPPNDFTKCPHFKFVSKKYPDINWNPDED